VPWQLSLSVGGGSQRVYDEPPDRQPGLGRAFEEFEAGGRHVPPPGVNLPPALAPSLREPTTAHAEALVQGGGTEAARPSNPESGRLTCAAAT